MTLSETSAKPLFTSFCDASEASALTTASSVSAASVPIAANTLLSADEDNNTIAEKSANTRLIIFLISNPLSDTEQYQLNQNTIIFILP